MTTSKFPYSHANFFSFSKFWVFDLKQTIRQYECRTEMRKLYLKWLYHKKIMEAAIDALSLTPPPPHDSPDVGLASVSSQFLT